MRKRYQIIMLLSLLNLSAPGFSNVASAASTSPSEELWRSAKFPVGSTKLKIVPTAAESETITVARFVTDSSQELKSECKNGFKIKDARCDLTPETFGRSFDMGADLNPIQTQVTKAPDDQSAACHARIVRPDQIVRLNLQMKCVTE